MTPLERAARAAHAEHNDDPAARARAVDPAWDGWKSWLPVARAVLTAIREPSERMRRALRDNVPITGHEWDYLERETLSNGMVLDPEADCWAAMIDAAMEEE